MSNSSSQQQHYQVNVSWRFILASLLGSSLISFFVGYGARIYTSQRIQALSQQNDEITNTINTNAEQQDPRLLSLPTPVIRRGKEIPHTIYTSKHFDTSRTVTSASLWLETAEDEDDEIDYQPPTTTSTTDHDNIQNHTSPLNISGVPIALAHEEFHDNDEIHLPVGQHLLIDIDNVDSEFLNSKKDLATAMVEMVYECGLTMLSYHCFSLEPSGISCAGVLLESHVAFHTWPEEGVITMDLFTCGPTSLLPMVDFIENLFSRPRRNDDVGSIEPPKMIWAYKHRGFTNIEVGDRGAAAAIAATQKLEDSNNDNVNDLFAYPMGVHGMDMKKEIASFETDDSKQFYVYAIEHGSSSTSHTHTSSYEHQQYKKDNPDLFRPDRLLFSNGALKLRLSGEAASSESLVHPAMFSHPSPKRVAILGSAEGSTLREVLKHNTVNDVTMIGADETIIEYAKTHLTDWSDCSNLLNVPTSCFDDQRVTILTNEETERWHNQRSLLGMHERSEFDVIIIDDLAHGLPNVLSTSLKNDANFVKTLHSSLNDQGIIVIRGIDGRTVKDVPIRNAMDSSSDIKNGSLLRTLEAVGFEETRHYQENHGGFGSPQKYVIAFKSSKTAKNWLNDESLIALEMTRRATRTVDGKTPFKYFDGSTMNSYRTSTAAVDALTCQRDLSAEGCDTSLPFTTPSIRLSNTCNAPTASESPARVQNQSLSEGSQSDVKTESSHMTLKVQPFASHRVATSVQESEVLI